MSTSLASQHMKKDKTRCKIVLKDKRITAICGEKWTFNHINRSSHIYALLTLIQWTTWTICFLQNCMHTYTCAYKLMWSSRRRRRGVGTGELGASCLANLVEKGWFVTEEINQRRQRIRNSFTRSQKYSWRKKSYMIPNHFCPLVMVYLSVSWCWYKQVQQVTVYYETTYVFNLFFLNKIYENRAKLLNWAGKIITNPKGK